MDHLPPIVGRKDLPLTVPCVCDPMRFDGMQFEDFPTRQGFHLISQDGWPVLIFDTNRSRLTAESLSDIAQAWLFFGLLVEVLKVSGVLVDINDFVQEQGEDRFITTKALSGYLSEWERRESLLPKKDRKAHFRRQQHMLMIANHFRLYQISGQYWQDSFWFFDDLSQERYLVAVPFLVEFSITILAETLDRASRRAYGNLDQSLSGNMFHNQTLMDALRYRGWCPSEISLIIQGLEDTAAYFASQLDRPRLKADHSRCSINKCLAFNISTEQYRTKHTAGCGGCEHISIDAQELAAVLRFEGGTPPSPRASLRLPRAHDILPIELKIDTRGPYVAISHVWSDGLGNPDANSLPACQLLRLYKMVAALDVEFAEGNPTIWIDSLLVPVKKGREKRLALTRLCDYYRAAKRVLVLDSDLLHASRQCSKEECIARILFSTWMRRLWTLEEGILSRNNLVFQFRDGTVSLNDIIDPNHYSSSMTGIGTDLNGSLLLLLPNLAEYFRQPPESIQPRRPMLANLLPTLEYRATTKAVDETLCIAHILGIDPSALLVTEDVQLRMKIFIEILAMQENIFPMRFLFTNQQKLTLDGFRWAPISFMTLDHEDLAYVSGNFDKCWTTCNNKGLMVHGMGGFTFPFGEDDFTEVNFLEVDYRIYRVAPVPVGKSCRAANRLWSSKSKAENGPNLHWTPEFQAILGRKDQVLAVISDGSYGLLISVYDSMRRADSPEGSLIYARPISQVYIQELETRNQNYLASGADSSAIKFTNPDWDFKETEKQMHEALEKVFDPKTATFSRCRAIDPCQRWCIG